MSLLSLMRHTGLSSFDCHVAIEYHQVYLCVIEVLSIWIGTER